jgi:hypothetical protein
MWESADNILGEMPKEVDSMFGKKKAKGCKSCSAKATASK